MSDERPWIIVMRVADMPEGDQSPGAVQLPCVTCLAMSWLSAPGQQMLARGGRVICSQCATPMIRKYKTGVVPGAFEEVEMVLGSEARSRAELIHRMINSGKPPPPKEPDD